MPNNELFAARKNGHLERKIPPALLVCLYLAAVSWHLASRDPGKLELNCGAVMKLDSESTDNPGIYKQSKYVLFHD